MDSSVTPHPAQARRVSWRAGAFVAVLVLYVALTLCVIYRTPILQLDSYLRGLDLRHRVPESWKKWISFYVAFGQRGPATLIFLPYFLWTAWRRRSVQPLVLLVTALVLLNVSVGIAKIYFGRLGPLRTHDTHAIFDGGNIYPSGHVSNTVVLYGLMAIVAIEHRRWFVAAAVWLSITVGIGTIYLNTHWFSDVVGGWVAGGLVLLALPWVMPLAERLTGAMITLLRSRRSSLPRSAPVRPERPRRVGPAGARPALSGGPMSGALHRMQTAPRLAQPKSMPASSAARSQTFAATAASFEASDDVTRGGDPRSPATSSGL